MAPFFVFPTSLRNLEEPVVNEQRVYAHEVTLIESLSAREVDELMRGVAYELSVKDVWCIEEQGVFDQVYSLVRGFSFLQPQLRESLVESLCTNYTVLNPSITALSRASGTSNEDAEYILQQMQSLRNAVKIYSYFLHCILTVEDAVKPQPVPKTPGGKKKQSQSRRTNASVGWNWDAHRTRIFRLFATALQADLRLLYAMSQPEENLITFFATAAFSCLENPAYVKEEELKEALLDILAACSAKYGYIVPVASTILTFLHKYEHLPVHLADLVTLTEKKYHNSSLAVAVLQEIGHVSSEDFKRDSFGADNVSAFLVAMAERLPKLMTMNLSIVTCHLDGEAYKMRNGIVQVIGALIIRDSKNSSQVAVGDDLARLRSKQAMVDILLERARDQNAYTRSKVLQTWANLCEEGAVSIGHWNLVASIAAGRLEDKGAIVRKSALQLLTTLLQFNPFGPSLRTTAFEATLEQYREKLREIESTHPTDTEEVQAPLGGGHMDDSIEGSIMANDQENTRPDATDTVPDTQYDDTGPSQVEQSNVSDTADVVGLEQTRALVASLESGLQFARCIERVMDVMEQLLASSCSDDVKHTITLLMLARQFGVEGVQRSLQKMLPLVFSKEKSVYEAVEGAFTSLYMKRSPSETALNLITLTIDASIGNLASIEALVSKFAAKGDISQGTIAALWNYFTFNVPDVTPLKSRGALAVLCMAAKSQPQLLSSHIQSVMDIGLGRRAQEDPLLARYACIALQRLAEDDRVSLGSNHKLFSNLSNLITGPGLPEESWYSAAEQAINAVYTLHPTPEIFSSSLLVKFSQLVFTKSSRRFVASPFVEKLATAQNGCSSSPKVETDGYTLLVSSLSRFLFALSHIALKHLVYIEMCIRKARKQRVEKEKAAADVAADFLAKGGGVLPEQASIKSESIDVELGLAASEDARLDILLEKAESEIISGGANRRFLIGTMAPIVAKICHNMGLLQQYPRLQSSAMLALCKLMAIDADFCERNLQLLFTVAQISGETAVRSNCIVALGDLAFRFPNVLEPWTEHMYSRLNDTDSGVRKNTVLVLTHLILNDMVKVKGHISEMVLRLEDEDERIQNLAKLFFHELSNKGNNPIYNLLPDILSRLSSRPNLQPEIFRSVMQFLINAITKDKHLEGLLEKLCLRFSGTTDPKNWRDLSYCLTQLTYTDKSLKKMIELFPKYQHALGEKEVFEHFKSVVAKAKKFAKSEVKGLADDFESKIIKVHEEKKERDLAVKNAQAHQLICGGDGAHTDVIRGVDSQDLAQGADFKGATGDDSDGMHHRDEDGDGECLTTQGVTEARIPSVASKGQYTPHDSQIRGRRKQRHLHADPDVPMKVSRKGSLQSPEESDEEGYQSETLTSTNDTSEYGIEGCITPNPVSRNTFQEPLSQTTSIRSPYLNIRGKSRSKVPESDVEDSEEEFSREANNGGFTRVVVQNESVQSEQSADSAEDVPRPLPSEEVHSELR